VDSCTLIPPICPFWANKSSKDLSLPRCFKTLPSNEFHKRSSTTPSFRHYALDTYKRILELHPQQKAIIASGFSETTRVKEAQKLGAGAYVKKPYILEKVGVAVRDELDR